MPREYKNLVSDTTATVGTADFVLSGVVGFPGTQTFAAHTNGVEVGYHVFSAGNVEFEAGRGLWDAVNSILTRVSIETSSAALNAKVSFSAGVKTVISTPVASDMNGMVPYTGATGNVDLGANSLSSNIVSVSDNLSIKPGGYVWFTDPTKEGYIEMLGTSGKYGFYGVNNYGGLDFTNITGGDKNFTFPNTSGTVALTSDIPVVPSISGLVPYTGATTHVDLGAKNLTAALINGAVIFTNDGGIGIGNTNVSTNSFALGALASASSSESLAIGVNAFAATDSVAVGRSSFTEARSTSVGRFAGGLGTDQISLGQRAGRAESGVGALMVDVFERPDQGFGLQAAGRAAALLYGVMKPTATVHLQTLNTASAFSATYGMNIPLGQTYKIGGVPIGGAISNVISVLTTIAADTTYAVASYLKIDAALTVDGNLIITG